MQPQRTQWLGKYRDLLLAIGLFLVLDLGVLVVNVIVSRQIEADATRINLAGELRVYTQQLTKSLLTLHHELAGGESIQTSIAQLGQATDAFDRALAQLDVLTAAHSAGALLEDGEAHAAVAEMRGALARTWRPLAGDIRPVLAATLPSADGVAIAMTRAVAVNVRLMQEADDLTHQLETMARDKARRLRQLQIGAIVLATLNFVFIIFKFLRRLRRSDRDAELARDETERILDTVREGLFLIDRDGRIGAQRSASLDALLGRPVRTGDDAVQLLRSLFGPQDAEAAEHFVHVLFNGRVKPALLQQLNPLHEIELPGSVHDRSGSRYLTIEFDQVRRGPEVDALLVTVFDVSQKVRLEHALAGAQARAQGDVELLLGVLDHDPASVHSFLDSARAKLLAANRGLESVRPARAAYRSLVDDLGREIHAIKGEAAALGLGTVERQAHEFEDLIAGLRRMSDLGGENLIPVAVQLNALGGQLDRVAQLVARVERYGHGGHGAASIPAAADCKLQPLLRQVEQLAQRVAGELDKAVRVEVAAPRFAVLPERLARLLGETLPQLVRNAVVHGIEPSAERLRAGKPASGLLQLDVQIAEDGTLTVGLRDDGRGIVPAVLREQLVARGFRTAAQVAAMRDAEVVALLFEPGVSSRDETDRHAGRGDGLAVVRSAVQAVGGRLRVHSEPASFTEFTLHLKAPAWITA